jgi:hypothetical protein
MGLLTEGIRRTGPAWERNRARSSRLGRWWRPRPDEPYARPLPGDLCTAEALTGSVVVACHLEDHGGPWHLDRSAGGWWRLDVNGDLVWRVDDGGRVAEPADLPRALRS